MRRSASLRRQDCAGIGVAYLGSLEHNFDFRSCSTLRLPAFPLLLIESAYRLGGHLARLAIATATLFTLRSSSHTVALCVNRLHKQTQAPIHSFPCLRMVLVLRNHAKRRHVKERIINFFKIFNKNSQKYFFVKMMKIELKELNPLTMKYCNK